MHVALRRSIVLAPVETALLPWTLAGAPRLTIVVKATFHLRHGGTAVLVAPDPLEHEDDHVDDDLERSLRAASDLAPYLPMGGVVLTGHAVAPGGRPVSTLAARLALLADTALVDKTIHVSGDLRPGATEPAPFTSMPLVYERAYGGPGVADNPIGVGGAGSASASRRPNLTHPDDPTRPACFGPIPRTWPRRRALFEGLADAAPGGALELSRDLDFRAFHPAPADQWTPLLRGDEWLVLEHLSPQHARLETRLPSVRALARFAGPSTAGAFVPVPLVADTLLVDADRGRASLLFRGHVELDPESARGECVFHTTLEHPGLAPEWAEPRVPSSAPDPASRARPSAPHVAHAQPTPSSPRHVAPTLAEDDDPLLSTQLDEPAPKAPALPFRAPLEVPRAPTFGAPPPSSPHSGPRSSPGPHAEHGALDREHDQAHDREHAHAHAHDHESDHDETGQMLRPVLPALPFEPPRPREPRPVEPAPASQPNAPLPPPPPWLASEPAASTLELTPGDALAKRETPTGAGERS